MQKNKKAYGNCEVKYCKTLKDRREALKHMFGYEKHEKITEEHRQLIEELAKAKSLSLYAF